MSRYTPRKSAEFESRQMAFEFGEACRFVANLVANVKNDLKKWACAFFRPVLATIFPPEQKILNLDFGGINNG